MRLRPRLNGIVGYTTTVTAAFIAAVGSARGSDVAQRLSSAPQSIEWTVETGKIPFDIAMDQPMILARINGEGPYYFGVDTGVLGATIDDDIAARAHLRPSPRHKAESDPTIRTGLAKIVQVEELNIGGVLLKDMDMAVADYDLDSVGGRRYDGTLGLSVFAKCLLTLDYPELSFVLKRGELPPPDGYQVIEYNDRNGLAAVPLKFGDVGVDAVLDTYSVEAFVLSDKLRDKIELLPQPEEDAAEASSKDEEENTRASGKIGLGTYKLVNPPVQFHDGASTIGQLVWYEFSITLDQKNRRLGLERDDTSFMTFEAPSKFGFDLTRRGPNLAITRIVPGTPACRRGLKVGDLILGINREYARDYDDAALRRLLEEEDLLILHVEREKMRLLFRVDTY